MDLERDLEQVDDASDSRERRLTLLAIVLVVSLGIHLGLMTSLSDCAFAPLSGPMPNDRKWTKDLPTMHVETLTEDPLAKMLDVETPPPAAAPDTEQPEERVERLAGTVERAPAPNLPDTPFEPPSASTPLPEPAPVEAAQWQPRQQIAEITTPTVPDEQAALPRLVIPRVARTSRAADITPAVDLPQPESVASAAPKPVALTGGLKASTSTGANGEGGTAAAFAAPAPVPPPVDLPNAASLGIGGSPIGQPPAPTILPDAERRVKERAAAGPSAAEKAKAVPPPPATLHVDEKVVEAEKKAVRTLRDENVRDSRPFDANVQLELTAWTDWVQTKRKYFRIRVKSKAQNPLPVVSKDLVFLLDASGSIGNPRLKSCRKAISAALRRLNTGDRFNVVAFRDKFTFAFSDVAWKEVSAQSLDAADDWMAALTAHGQTDVFRTLRGVLAMPRDPARPVVAFVVTDGDATSGLTRSAEIITRFAELNDGLVSIYMYGVKSQANAYLMDMVTRGSRGGWSLYEGYTRGGAGAGIPELAKTFERPVLTDISVLFSSSSRTEVYPRRVTNLCMDAPVEIYGSCPVDQTEAVFVLRGLNGADTYESMFRIPFGKAAPGTEQIKTDWAQCRMHELIAAYTKKPDVGLMRTMRTFAKTYQIPIPYEKEIK